jgi:hypothetical protein
MADESGLIRNRRYIVWDAEKASLNKLLLLHETKSLRTRMFIAVFTRAHLWSLIRIQSTSLRPFFLRFIIMYCDVIMYTWLFLMVSYLPVFRLKFCICWHNYFQQIMFFTSRRCGLSGGDTVTNGYAKLSFQNLKHQPSVFYTTEWRT